MLNVILKGLGLDGVITANRVAAAIVILTGLAAFVTGIVGVLPEAWANYALIAAGLLTKLVTALKYLDGSQKFDTLVAKSADTQTETQAAAKTAKATSKK